MPSVADYKLVRVGEWKFWGLESACDAALLEQLIAIAERQAVSKHPQVIPFTWSPDGNTSHYFLKVFHQRGGLARVKELLGQTKARRFWSQGLALNAAGFAVPLTIGFGEKSRRGLPDRSMVLTERLEGKPLPLFLTALNILRDGSALVKSKRSALAQLGHLVRRFHDLGFVHGDLVATNIFVSGQSLGGQAFYFMDNDRTRRYPPRLTFHLRKRNLVQLNRIPLANITLQDRMRFLHSYIGVTRLTAQHGQFARWLEARTRQRRKECDGVDPKGSFRQLMHWVPDAQEQGNPRPGELLQQ